MTHPRPAPSSNPPDWPHCGHGTTPEDPVGCRGIHVTGHTSCLAHLADADRDAYLAGLTPGADIDHRGTPFTEPLLDVLLDALRDPATGHPNLGDAWFESASFKDNARFESATFRGVAVFGSATFEYARFESATFQRAAGFQSATFQDDAWFESATFQGAAWFVSATFQGTAGFKSATFQGTAGFESATFERDARFESATFQGAARFEFSTFEGGWFDLAAFRGTAVFQSAAFQRDARFESATFQGDARFESATFQGDARFEQVVFERAASLGPLVCAGRVVLPGAVFSGPVTLSFAARRVECRRTRWSSTAEVRLRYATVDFADAVFEYPLTIAAEVDPFVLPNGQPVAEQTLAGAPDGTVRMASLRGVDAAHLVLADVDLSGCLFTGTVHLDQLRLEGTCSFDKVPPGTHWRRGRPIRSPSAAPSPRNTTGARTSRKRSGAGT
ncbi:pentapeptide repeat-containing protein [Streptomyces sp. NPDC058231]|uniref:pentapeptide repeat-containing protein n=1 Tax=Streptomyces sp. NPDC058231 TaxID=3346392 RepID=UPI0036EE52E6